MGHDIRPAGRNVVLTVPDSARLSSRFLPIPVRGSLRSAGRTLFLPLQAREITRTRIALTVDKPDGSFAATTQLPGAAVPGTYRVTLCSSDNGVTCAPSASTEWIAVHKPSTNLNDAMPPTDQPPCAAAGGNCTVLEIQDPVAPKVAGFARAGVLLSAATFTTTHQGQAQYVFAGLAPGTYNVTSSGTAVASGSARRPRR